MSFGIQVIQSKAGAVSVERKNNVAAEHHDRSEDYDVIELVIEANLKKVTWLLTDHEFLANDESSYA